MSMREGEGERTVCRKERAGEEPTEAHVTKSTLSLPCPTGDSERNRPRRLTEPKGTGWYPEPQDGDWGQPSSSSQQAG